MTGVDTLWAWVTDGDGIVAEILPGLGVTPFVFASEKNALRVRDLAADIARKSGKTLRLVRYERGAELAVIAPTPRH